MDARFLAALLLTLAIEVPVLVAGMRILPPASRPPLRKVLFAGFIASIATLPYLWFLVPEFTDEHTYLPLGEALVIVVEAIVFRFVLDLPYRTCLWLSAACNLCSLAVGLAILHISR